MIIIREFFCYCILRRELFRNFRSTDLSEISFGDKRLTGTGTGHFGGVANCTAELSQKAESHKT